MAERAPALPALALLVTLAALIAAERDASCVCMARERPSVAD